MRTIVSQDGKMIINAEKANRFCIDKLEKEYEKNFCLWRIYVIFDVWTKITEYSTEKHALQVLNMLNEWLTMQRTFSCFSLPKDSEELNI